MNFSACSSKLRGSSIEESAWAAMNADPEVMRYFPQPLTRGEADAMLDRSNAMQSLNETPLDPAAELEKKYADGAKNAAVEDELEKMKKEMGL